ncbi:DUF1768-domain-containing protein [Xylaria acuta]|nr:DUF1768-domain-containing protein [Xylaria acuta]
MPPNRNRVSKRVASKGGASASSSTLPDPTPSDPNSKPIYFWRPRELATGFLSQWYASQPFRDRAPGSEEKKKKKKIYATAEHYMMHHKALLFGDAEIAAAVLEVPATSAGKVKALGRAVRGFDQATWERERVRIVTEGNWCKFSLPVVLVEDPNDDDDDDDDDEEDAGQGKGKGKGKEREHRMRAWSLGDHEDAQVTHAASFRDVLLATGSRELVEASPFDRIWGVGFAAKGAEGRRDKWGMNLLGKCLMDVREEFRKEAEAAGVERGEELQ